MLDTLKNKKNLIALVGASNDPKKYGNKILLDLISKGYNVAPINNQEEMISGIKSVSYTHLTLPTKRIV